MKVKCYRETTADGTRGALVNEMVYSNSLQWLPVGKAYPNMASSSQSPQPNLLLVVY
jgi:hypothetical protein